MSFVLTRDDLTPGRLKAAVPFFLLIFLSFAVCIVVFTLGVRRQLVRTELAETTRQLSAYLQKSSAAPFKFGPAGGSELERLGGLAFIRIIRGQDRLLLGGETLSSLHFQELLHAEKLPDTAWFTLPGDPKATVWSVVGKSLDNGVVIQAGRESSASYRQYRQLCRFALNACGIGFVLALVAALFCVKKMVTPLTQLHDELETLMEEGREQLLSEGRSTREKSELYRQINRLLRQNRRLVSEMQASLDNVAHDLRTPMTRLRSVAEFGLREDSDIGKLRESLADCLEESERVLAMLRIMMSVAEAETGTIHLEREHLDLAESIVEMVSLYEYVAEERKITMKTDLAAGLVIDADRTRIAQVWANLIDNGLKYGKEGGWLRVESAAAEESICVRFHDNGMGISASEQPKIWERLYRGDRSRSQQGLGLGLNFVKAIVEAHGGAVQVESSLHQGSCFTVTLPRSQEPLLAIPVKEKSQISGE